MAGTNKTLKANEVLFNIGDPADVMYIVRRGSLRVYFPKGADEVTLATLKDGAIVGEMAFFDDKPRSASVKAAEPTEVTVISRADFDKLLSQVPKWMVTMMQSLVGRLRQTNERIQTLEAAQASASSSSGAANAALILPHQKHPFQHVLRAMQIITLSLAKDGEKDGREITLPRESPTKLWNDLSGEEQGIFDKTLAILEKNKFIALKSDASRVAVIAFTNRGLFANFLEFFGRTARAMKPIHPFISTTAVELFASMVEQVATSGYDSLSMSLKNMMSQAKSKSVEVKDWPRAMAELALIPDLKVQKAGDDLSLKITTKDHKIIANYLKVMSAFVEGGLV